MNFKADFHVHSKFSRATAKNLDLENLYIAARLKGITVVGTGDFTHPGWFSELKEKLVPAEPGLFELRKEIAEKCEEHIPLSCKGPVRFILVSEISNIYKKKNRTRKNHNLVFLPDRETAEKFNSKLNNIGNIKSDGRPILGLDAKDLLALLLETSDSAFLVPAHIWTPWFSLLGSKSGFDSIEECFEELTPNIFAVETGLSSDPKMNWRVSGLDGVTLISNSDAHSPLKIGREANLFDTDLSYDAIRSAIETGDPGRFLGTLEFYPEEGKYHLDGHRKCGVRLRPEETLKQGTACAVCGKPLTLGVLYRVEELADRSEGVKPEKSHPFYNLIPLSEILSEIFMVGPGSKKVAESYSALIEKLGPELSILHNMETAAIAKAGIPLLAEAVERMRRNEIKLSPGFDGEFGKIKIFEPQEREKLIGQKPLFLTPGSPEKAGALDTSGRDASPVMSGAAFKPPEDNCFINSNRHRKTSKQGARESLNEEQKRAVEHIGGPLAIIAGPGTGKTRTLTHRIAYLINKIGIPHHTILALTFTNKAAEEMRSRLKHLLKDNTAVPPVNTFHSFCFNLLSEIEGGKNRTVIDDDDRRYLIADAVSLVRERGIKTSCKPEVFLNAIVQAKQNIVGPGEYFAGVDDSEQEAFAAVYEAYQMLLSSVGAHDYEDLIFKTVRILEKQSRTRIRYQNVFRYIFVDEYQDINHGQYRILKALAPTGVAGNNIFVIGDPDQSIYGFRGSDVTYFNRFADDYPDACIMGLGRNYRSAKTIIEASYQVIAGQNRMFSGTRVYSEIDGIKTITILEQSTEKAEAVAIGKIIERIIGGFGFHSMDFGRIDYTEKSEQRSFSDFAILYRTGGQGKIFADVFDKEGIPYQVVSRESIFKRKGIAELLSLLRVIAGTPSFADLGRIADLEKPVMNRITLDGLKNWSYKNGFTVREALVNARRFPLPGMSRRLRMRLHDFAGTLLDLEKETKAMPVDEKIGYLADKTGLSKIIKEDPQTEEAFKRVVQSARAFGEDSSEYFLMHALRTDTDVYAPESERVSLMTMHTAKGLEFPVVFIAGCEKDFIPFTSARDPHTDLDEERRLFYVAMTRAKHDLYLTYARKRRIYGKQTAREISPFVRDIEKRLIEQETSIGKTPKKEKQNQLTLF